MEDVASGGDGGDLAPRNAEAKEETEAFSVDISLNLGMDGAGPAVSGLVGKMPSAVVSSGDTEETEEEGSGPSLPTVIDGSDQGPCCLGGVVTVEEAGTPTVLWGRDEFHLAAEPVLLASTELTVAAHSLGGELASSGDTELTGLVAADVSLLLGAKVVIAAGGVDPVRGEVVGRGGDEPCPSSVLGRPGDLDADTPVLPLIPEAVIPMVVVSEGEGINEVDGLVLGLMMSWWEAVAGRGVKSPLVPMVVESVFWRAVVSTPTLASSREGTEGVNVANVVSDELGLEVSRAVKAFFCVELVLSHVAMGRDVVRAHSQEAAVFSLLVVRVKDSPETSEVNPKALLPEVGEAEATTDTGPRVDCVPNPGDLSARPVPWDPVRCPAVSVPAPAMGSGLTGLGVLGT